MEIFMNTGIKRNIITFFDVNKSKWVIKEEGRKKELQSFNTPQSAIENGDKLAEKNKVKNIIHYIDGTIKISTDFT